MVSDRRAIVASVGGKERHPIDAEIAHLRRDLSLDCLDVGEMGLGLDENIAARDSYYRVATAQIAGDRDRNFGPPPRARWQARSEAFEEREVRSVSNRISVRMQLCSQFETDDRCQAGDEIDRQRPLASAFEPHDRLRAHSNATGNFANAQAARLPRDVEPIADPHAQEPTSPLATGELRVATGHRPHGVASSLPAASLEGVDRCGEQTTNETGPIIPEGRPLDPNFDD